MPPEVNLPGAINLRFVLLVRYKLAVASLLEARMTKEDE